MLLFILDGLTPLDIKSQEIKSFTYFGILVVTPLTLIWNLLFFKTKNGKVIGATLPVLALIGLLITGPLNIVFSASAWKTQKIVYQNKHLNFKKIELQIQDVGALGHNKRTVEVLYVTDWFMIVGPVAKDIDKSFEWVKVDREVNEPTQ